ncbi:MAG TPA: hypothetical protein VFC80_07145 [Sphaerochaeta sp.]|nr:hypothetical protein [Sphaerochaeta sp.]
MKRYQRLRHPIAHQMIIMIRESKQQFGTRVGDSWQPDVAQFLLEMVPHALDLGLDLSDIAPLVEKYEYTYSDDDFFPEDEEL